VVAILSRCAGELRLLHERSRCRRAGEAACLVSLELHHQDVVLVPGDEADACSARVADDRFGDDAAFKRFRARQQKYGSGLQHAIAGRGYRSSSAFAGTRRQSDDEARSGDRAGNSDVARSVESAGSGWRGHRVAGDYYDAFYPTASAEEKGKLLLVVADVAGKSIPAALLMATLQASLRTIAGEGTPLEELVVRLNRYASAHSLDGRRFTTAVLAEYDPATRQLAYVNAGHNPPILRRAGGETEKLEAGGLPLGIDGSATFDTAAMELKPGDALIFYTDGVIEAFNDKSEEFGNDRWINAIRALPDWGAQESLEFLMKPVDAFVGFTRQSDDITCLVFRCK
jgi:hypothetical protein